MFHSLARLLRYRGLIQSLVARELKARYRGSVLGFFWSFINPLLLLLVYSFVFTVVPDAQIAAILSDPNLSLQDACARLIDAANAGGGPDNITAVVLQVDVP